MKIDEKYTTHWHLLLEDGERSRRAKVTRWAVGVANALSWPPMGRLGICIPISRLLLNYKDVATGPSIWMGSNVSGGPAPRFCWDVLR